jgi:preprotein translocase subunit SecG
MLEVFFTVIHVLVCLFLVLTILLQAGRGGGVSAAFGGGAGVALGQRSAASVLSKVTTGCAITFMVTSMVLAAMSGPNADDSLKGAAQDRQGAVPPVSAPAEGSTPAAAPSAEGSAPAQPAAPAQPSAAAPAQPEGAAPAAPESAAPAQPEGAAPASQPAQ